jgi:hypothetical protein
MFKTIVGGVPTARLFFGGQSVVSLLATSFQSWTISIPFVHTTDSTLSVLGAFTFFSELTTSATLSGSYYLASPSISVVSPFPYFYSSN